MNMNIVKYLVQYDIPTSLHCALPIALATTHTQYFINCFMTKIKFPIQIPHTLNFEWLLYEMYLVISNYFLLHYSLDI